jgi:outer membrane immunogenic protein
MDHPMKKILLSSVALIGLTSLASAADLPRRTAPPVVYAPAIPVFTWTGFYIGGNAGYGFADSDNDRNRGRRGRDERGGDQEGFVGGGQIGFNYQFTPGSGFVIGVETDIQYADLEEDRRTRRARAVRGDRDLSNGVDWFGTVRGRAGYAFDRVLVYGTGGFAYAEDNGGWTVGGGVEWALPTSFALFGPSNAVTFKIEGLYVNLDQDRNDVRRAARRAGGDRNDEFEFGVVRAGFNVKF